MHLRRLFSLASALLLLWTCPSLAQVSRREVIALADTYLTFRWKPTEANMFHGADTEGIMVETPDRSFSRPGTRPGWWVPGEVNVGMPYKWGGFSSPAEFQQGLREGRYAGDLYTAEKRRLGDAAVSKQAIGIDCSGLVSRCWRLERAYSTYEFAQICTPLPSIAELKPGDILNSPNNHVLIFKAFGNEQKDRILAYEAGSPPSWKVLLNSIPLTLLNDKGYQPLRYRKIRE